MEFNFKCPGCGLKTIAQRFENLTLQRRIWRINVYTSEYYDGKKEMSYMYRVNDEQMENYNEAEQGFFCRNAKCRRKIADNIEQLILYLYENDMLKFYGPWDKDMIEENIDELRKAATKKPSQTLVDYPPDTSPRSYGRISAGGTV